MSRDTDTLASAAGELRGRILAAANHLIAQGGIDAATTRAVAAAAGVQPPTLYRLFGDKDGLLEAVAEQAMADYVAQEGARPAAADPVQELRRAWDIYIAFSLAQPAVFRLVYVPHHAPSAAFMAGQHMLLERVRAIARAGRLRVTEERAVDLIHAMGTGTALTALQRPAHERQALTHAAREAVLDAILVPTGAVPASGLAPATVTLRASLGEVAGLTPGERLLLDELLQRIGGAPP